MKTNQSNSAQRGYSLMELAVAFVPLSLLGLLLFAAFGFTWRFTQRSAAGIDAVQGARLALQAMANELREASALPGAIVIWSRQGGDDHDAVGFLSARTEGAGRVFNTDTRGTPSWQGAVVYLFDPAHGQVRRVTGEPEALASSPLRDGGRVLAREVRQLRLVRLQDVIVITLTVGTSADKTVLEVAVRPRN